MAQECMYCGAEQEDESDGHSYPPYAYDEWVCDECWNNCPECGCSEWRSKTSKSTRKHNKKICEDCGFSFITSPATG